MSETEPRQEGPEIGININYAPGVSRLSNDREEALRSHLRSGIADFVRPPEELPTLRNIVTLESGTEIQFHADPDKIDDESLEVMINDITPIFRRHF